MTRRKVGCGKFSDPSAYKQSGEYRSTSWVRGICHNQNIYPVSQDSHVHKAELSKGTSGHLWPSTFRTGQIAPRRHFVKHWNRASREHAWHLAGLGHKLRCSQSSTVWCTDIDGTRNFGCHDSVLIISEAFGSITNRRCRVLSGLRRKQLGFVCVDQSHSYVWKSWQIYFPSDGLDQL